MLATCVCVCLRYFGLPQSIGKPRAVLAGCSRATGGSLLTGMRAPMTSSHPKKVHFILRLLHSFKLLQYTLQHTSDAFAFYACVTAAAGPDMRDHSRSRAQQPQQPRRRRPRAAPPPPAVSHRQEQASK